MTGSRFAGDEAIELVTVPAAPGRRPAPRWPWLFAAAMSAASAIAAVIGIGLGYTAATRTIVPVERWSQSVQAHGRIQLLTWLAVFVVALLFEFVVRFHDRPPLSPWRRSVALLALGAGGLLQGAGHLFHDTAGWLLETGALVSLGGAALAAWLIVRVRPSPGVGFERWWLRAAAGWLLVASVVGAGGAFRANSGIAGLAESRLFVDLLLRGFAVTAIVGVGLRAFPSHLGTRQVPERAQIVLFAGLLGSLLLSVAASGAFDGPTSVAGRRAADLLFAGVLVGAALAYGILWPATFALRPHYQLLIPLAWAGAVLAAGLMAAFALSAGFDSRSPYEEGAARHLLLLGFIAPLMAGMALIVLEHFGSGALVGGSGRFLVGAFVLFEVAWLLRVVPVLMSDPPGDAVRVALGLAGTATAAGMLGLAAAAGRTAAAVARASSDR